MNKKNIERFRSIKNNQWKKPRFWCFHKDTRGSTTAGYKENQRHNIWWGHKTKNWTKNMQIQYQGIKVQRMSREGMLNSPESSPTQLVVTHSVDQYKPSGISYILLVSTSFHMNLFQLGLLGEPLAFRPLSMPKGTISCNHSPKEEKLIQQDAQIWMISSGLLYLLSFYFILFPLLLSITSLCLLRTNSAPLLFLPGLRKIENTL